VLRAASVPGVSTSGWASGSYTITVTYAGTTTGRTLCAASVSTASLAVVAPGQFAFGDGSYNPAASVGQTSLGFVVFQTKHGTSPTYTGQLGLITPGKWLFHADVTSFGLTSTTQGLLGGTGSLYWWNSSLNKGRGGWPASFGITISYAPVAPEPTSLPNSSPVTRTKGAITIG
jgi:hypothetical protein